VCICCQLYEELESRVAQAVDAGCPQLSIGISNDESMSPDTLRDSVTVISSLAGDPRVAEVAARVLGTTLIFIVSLNSGAVFDGELERIDECDGRAGPESQFVPWVDGWQN